MHVQPELESVLSRFACEHPVHTPATSLHQPPGPSRPPAAVAKDPQLTQLTKCVCCGLHWTSSKSAKQKRAHIDQCAKKNALTKETVRILIEKETSTSSLPKDATLMDSVVPASPVKKLKRRHVVSTVKLLPETRDSILHKAKDVLGRTAAPADLHPTQHFAQSALAIRNAKHPTLPGVHVYAEEPPSTQPFRASSLLHGGVLATERVTDSCERPVVSMFAQDSILSSDRHTKRPASPLHHGNDSRVTRQRLQ